MAETAYRKKLIEVAMPLEAINAASAREKSIRHGHPSTLHLWWARRPLAACRAVLFGQLVDDPSAWPEIFETEEDQKAERERLHELIERLVQWKNSNNEQLLNEARYEIARSLAWSRGEEPPTNPPAVLDYLAEHAPPVCDPFCGGGSIPLEAQRLGLKAIASDLNPVAVLITKALIEFPPRFAGLPPVNPEAQAALSNGGRWNKKGAEGLADDVRFYGKWMRDEAEKRIGHLYPKAKLPDGSEATVIAWLWARTVASPDPAQKGRHVPLISSFILSSKAGKEAIVVPVLDSAAPDDYCFEVKAKGVTKEEMARAKEGTKAGKAQDFVCLLSRAPISRSYIREQGKNGRLGQRLMAIVAEGRRGRCYLPPNAVAEESAASAATWPIVEEARETFLAGKTPTRAMITGGVCSAYGLSTWGHLFTPRQLVALTTFSDLVNEAREQVLKDTNAACAAGLCDLPDDNRSLEKGGAGPRAYADAVTVYLGLAVDRLADRSSSLCGWDAGYVKIRNTFGRQALPMVWDYAEGNPFSHSTGNFEDATIWIVKVVATVGAGRTEQVVQGNSANGWPWGNAVISSDPPYYDNIGYSELSDFFYVWLRRSLKGILGTLFATVLVPKEHELVATPYRHGGAAAAERFFMDGMRRALANMARAQPSELPLTIYYAFKQAEIEREGVVSTGWATFLDAVIAAGFGVDGTWPVRSELSNRMIGQGTNALASSIVLVCRKRVATAQVTTKREFLQALDSELPKALRLLQQSAIAPVDLAQAAIGPGMAVFTRYSAVLGADDQPISVREALAIINEKLDLFLSEIDSELDAHSRFAVTWFEQHGMKDGPFDDAETLSKRYNVAVRGVEQAGILRQRAGKVQLLKREEMRPDWSPERDSRPTVWEATQHLIRLLESNGDAAAAELLARLGSLAEPARDLAYRLYQICDRQKRADEARSYNALVVAWPELQRLAGMAPRGPAQGRLFEAAE